LSLTSTYRQLPKVLRRGLTSLNAGIDRALPHASYVG
jgi:hypothetical protein